MRDRRAVIMVLCSGSLILLVAWQVDWSIVGRQDPAKAEGLGPAGVQVLGELADRPQFSVTQLAVFLSIGTLLVIAGTSVSTGRGHTNSGLLLTLAGLVYLVGGLRRSDNPLFFTTGAVTTLMWVPVLLHAGITFPFGSFDRPLHRRFVIACYLFFSGSAALEWAIFDPRLHVAAGRSTSRNLLLVRDNPDLLRRLVPWLGAGFLAIGMVSLVVMGTKWWRGSPLYRRAISPLWCAGLTVIFTQMVGTVWASGHAHHPPSVFYTLRYFPTALVGVALFFGLLRYRVARLGVTRLMIEIGQAPLDEVLLPALRRAVSDPSLVLLLWSPGNRSYVGSDGRVEDLTKLDSQRAVAYLGRYGQPVGAIVHDRTLTDQPELMAAVREASTLALDNQRLNIQLAAQLTEVQQSRERLVTAADTERRRLERDVHDGAQQQLVAAAITLQRAIRATTPDQTHALMCQSAAQLESAIKDLREFARGLVPPLLRERGLAAALRSLVERAHLPIDLTTTATERFSDPIEACAYYVASEAVTNASKHAAATHVTIDLSDLPGFCKMSISDDGAGGATIAPGGGLAGLLDRAAALGGTLHIHSVAGQGTRLDLHLPNPSRSGKGETE